MMSFELFRLLRLKKKNFTFYVICIFHGCMVWIEKSVMRVIDLHHEACRVMSNSDSE